MIDKSLHVVKSKKFLESLYSYQVVPVGLRTKKSPCFPIISEDFDKSWRNALREPELIQLC